MHSQKQMEGAELPGETENLALQIEPKERSRLGAELREAYLRDKDSRKAWEEQLSMIYEKFFCFLRPRSFPWPDSAAASTPTMAQAAIQFGARAKEATWDRKGPLVAAPSGTSRQRRADRVVKVLNYQWLYESEMDDAMDQLWMQLPLVGSSFIQQDYDREREGVIAECVPAEDLVASFRYRGRVEKAQRLSKILRMDADEIGALAAEGYFVPEAAELRPWTSEPPRGAQEELHRKALELQGTVGAQKDGLRHLIQMHTRIRVNAELMPVIVTFDLAEGQVLRISERRDARGREICHFTQFTFLPNPTSGVYGLGLGQLMLSLVDCNDTLLRQILNQGTLATARPFFYAARSGIPQGTIMLEPGKGIPVDFNGERLADEFFVPNIAEPSATLVQMTDRLAAMARELSSVAEPMMGIAPRGSNTTATEFVGLLSESTKVFSGIYERGKKSMRRAADVTCALNEMYLPDQKYSLIVGADTVEFAAWAQAQCVNSDAQRIVAAAEQGAPVPPQVLAPAVQVVMNPPPPTPYSARADFSCVPGPDIQISANTMARAERIQLAREALTTVSSSPLTAGNPITLYSATRNLLDAAGADDTLIEKLLGPEPQPPPPPEDFGPDEENARFLEGQENHVLPNQNHDMHMAVHESWFRESEDAQLLDAAGKQAVMRHLRQHAAMRLRQGARHGAPAPVPPPAPGGSGPPIGGGPPPMEVAPSDALPAGVSRAPHPLDLAAPTVRARLERVEGLRGPEDGAGGSSLGR